MLSRAITAACFAALLSQTTAFGAIRLENRNLFLRFRDLSVRAAGGNLPLERIYNSKSPFIGWFGPGWGSTLEVRLLPQADGSLIVQEFGGGAEIRYDPAGADRQALLNAAIDRLAQWAAARGTFGSAAQRQDYANRLRSDARFREAQLNLAISSGKLKIPDVPIGQQFVAARFQYQYVTRTRDGFSRRLEDGSTQLFGTDGKIRQIWFGAATWRIQYDARERISQLSDPSGNVTRFRFNSAGLLERIDSPSGWASYSYDARKELARAVTGTSGKTGKTYRYTYDLNGRHLLLEADYPDGSKVQAAYEDLAHQENLRFFRDRNGMSTAVRAIPGSSDPLHRKFEILETSPDGHPAKTEYEYFDKVKANGEHWLYRKLETRGSRVTDTLFNECCEKPVRITETPVGKPSLVTQFTYDGYGRAIQKISPGGTEHYAYLGITNRLTRYDKTDSSGTSTVIFIYDTKERLIGAKRSQGQDYMFFYDAAGKLSRMGLPGSLFVDVNFTEQPQRVLLSSTKGHKWVLPDNGRKPDGGQKPLADAWNQVLELFLLSNNPLPS